MDVILHVSDLQCALQNGPSLPPQILDAVLRELYETVMFAIYSGDAADPLTSVIDLFYDNDAFSDMIEYHNPTIEQSVLWEMLCDFVVVLADGIDKSLSAIPRQLMICPVERCDFMNTTTIVLRLAERHRTVY